MVGQNNNVTHPSLVLQYHSEIHRLVIATPVIIHSRLVFEPKWGMGVTAAEGR
jgi:hypothetical protein